MIKSAAKSCFGLPETPSTLVEVSEYCQYRHSGYCKIRPCFSSISR